MTLRMSTVEMLGKKYGKLLVTSRAGYQGKAVTWECLCDCGEIRVIAGTGLRSGRHKSCGCSSPRFKSDRINSPGMVKTPTYNSWASMLYRCSDQAKGKSRRLYFEKGIRVCDKWQSFEGFIEDMGLRPSGKTIERKDGSEGYYKENCVWDTSRGQANNTSCNRLLTINSETKTVSQWSEATGIKANTIIYRLRRGWSVEKALTKEAIGLMTERKNRRQKPCESCGTIFIPRPSQLREGHGRFCSQKCNAKAR